MGALQRRHWLLLAAAAACEPSWAQPDGLPPAQTISLFGANIRYFELGQRGDKPTLVLLHGLGSSARGDWGQVMPALARTHHVLALDQLGFGESDKPAITYGIQIWVDFLGEFLREKTVAGGFTLMGESLGGWIAAQYTLQALRGEVVGPSFMLPRPGRLVLCNAAGFRETQSGLNRPPPGPGSGASLAAQKDILSRVFHAPKFHDDAAIRGGMAWSLAKGDSATIASVQGNTGLAREVLDGQLGGISIPTLVVWGQHDRLIPLALGERFAREIPGARLVVVPDTGHAPMIESPEAFLLAVQPFLR